MARHASTYRQNRRAQYLASQERINGIRWAEFNTYSRKQQYDIGTKKTSPMPLTMKELRKQMKGFEGLVGGG